MPAMVLNFQRCLERSLLGGEGDKRARNHYWRT
jgi:hypothetical protein